MSAIAYPVASSIDMEKHSSAAGYDANQHTRSLYHEDGNDALRATNPPLRRQDALSFGPYPTALDTTRPAVASAFAFVPEELRALPQWVIWHYGPARENGKRAKLPHTPTTYAPAKVTAPTTWGSFAQAASVAIKNPAVGIGFVFSPEDPYTGVDLDSCIEADGQIASWAQAILARLPGAYVEYSPSGTGLHAIVRAQLPGPGRRHGQVEIYDRGRYFTITGHALSAPAPIAAAQGAIASLYENLGGPAAVGDSAAPLAPEALDWGFVEWLKARMHRLMGADGVPYGATPQLRALLLHGQLPAGLDGSDSARRALVVRQLAAAGRLPEEIYLLARHIWAHYGFESNKRPQDLDTDALRLLAKHQVDPASYSAHSLARFAKYRHDPQRPASGPQAAPAARRQARRAVCTPDTYLAALSGLATASGVVLATRAERAQAAGVTEKTAQRRERELQAAGALRVDLYTHQVSDGRHTRASKITLIPVRTTPAEGADVHTGISTIAAEGADVHTGQQEAAQRSSTLQSPSESAVCIGENTVCVLPPTPRAPAPPAQPAPSPAPIAPAAAGAAAQQTHTVSSPCPARPLAELVSDAIDAYGTTGGLAARRRVIAHVRTVGGLKLSEGAIVRVYLAELARRKRARADAAQRRKAETMSPTKRRARLRSLERSIAADLALAADLRARPLTPEGDQRSPRSPEALTRRAWVWAHQYAIIAQVHEERQQQQLTPEIEEAQLLAEASAVIERLAAAGQLPANKPRASFKPATPAASGEIPQMAAPRTYDVAGMVRRLEERNRQLASCAD